MSRVVFCNNMIYELLNDCLLCFIEKDLVSNISNDVIHRFRSMKTLFDNIIKFLFVQFFSYNQISRQHLRENLYLFKKHGCIGIEIFIHMHAHSHTYIKN